MTEKESTLTYDALHPTTGEAAAWSLGYIQGVNDALRLHRLHEIGQRTDDGNQSIKGGPDDANLGAGVPVGDVETSTQLTELPLDVLDGLHGGSVEDSEADCSGEP